MKICKQCEELKPLDEFHNRSDSKDGKQNLCKICNIGKVKEWQEKNPEKYISGWKKRTNERNPLHRRAKRYGLEVEELQQLLDDADNKCSICGREAFRWLVVDHCHKTNKVRGILCEKCNQALGLFDDNLEFLENAIKYLTDAD